MGALRFLFRFVLIFGVVAGMYLWALRDRGWTPVDRAIARIDSGNMPMTIAVLGTSLTARGDWPDAVATRLSTCLNRRVTVQRYAEAGANSAWGRARIADVIAARPDLVLIEFAVNDADLRDGVSLPDSILNHTAMLRDLGRDLPGARVALMTTSPAFGMRGWLRPRLATYYASYGDLAADAETGVIDLYARWRDLPDAKALFPDGLHPDAAAATALIAPVVTDAIGKAAGRSCG
jgi:acyl-CoA thioesterase I